MKTANWIIRNLLICNLFASPVFLSAVLTAQAGAVEIAPRISDKEIITGLAELKAGQNAIQLRINDLKESTQLQLNELKESTNKRFDDVNKRFDDVNKRFDDVNKRFDDVNRRFDDVNNRFVDINGRFDDLNGRFDDLNGRFDILQWMFGLFITVALSLLGVMGRLLWNQQKKMTWMGASIETQKDEFSFLRVFSKVCG
jgi:hypothetical protein